MWIQTLNNVKYFLTFLFKRCRLIPTFMQTFNNNAILCDFHQIKWHYINNFYNQYKFF
ncbi:MAG: hypothetical protein RL131_852 [Bacteroidota bacterium]